MTEIQVTLCTSDPRGDHDADVRIAHRVEPGETVEHLIERVMRLGEFQQPYRRGESAAAWIELRYVDGTEPPYRPSEVAPF